MGAKELEAAAEAAAAAAEKQAEGEGGARGAGVGRAEQGSPFAALLRSDKEYRDFALDLRAQYATIGELLGAKLPSPHAPNVRYREADADAPGSGGSSGGGGVVVAGGGGGGGGGSLGARLPSMLFRPALMATTAAHRASLRAKGYAVPPRIKTHRRRVSPHSGVEPPLRIFCCRWWARSSRRRCSRRCADTSTPSSTAAPSASLTRSPSDTSRATKRRVPPPRGTSPRLRPRRAAPALRLSGVTGHRGGLGAQAWALAPRRTARSHARRTPPR